MSGPRLRHSRRVAIVGAIALSLASSLRAQETDPRPIIEQASRVYQGLTSFRSDFRQVISDPMIGTFESRGRLTQAGEARLAMRFTDPAGEAIIMDGEKLWVYTPSTTPGQVLRLKLPSDPVYGPNILAWILTRPTERYRSRYVRADAVGGRAVDIVALTPIDQSLPFTEAVVWLDQYDHLPRRLEIRERGGQQRTLTLSGVEINRRIAAATFRFEVPAGVRIVDQ